MRHDDTPSPAPSSASHASAAGSSLPAWPQHADYSGYDGDYEYAMAAAWEARCRLAMEHMRHPLICHHVDTSNGGVGIAFDFSNPLKATKCVCGLDEALAAIGQLPAVQVERT